LSRALPRRGRVPGHMELLRRVHFRKGLYLKRWGPHVARQIDLLVSLGLLDWQTTYDRRGTMHLTLTDRGRRVSYKKG
jgi:hypothetical protein